MADGFSFSRWFPVQESIQQPAVKQPAGGTGAHHPALLSWAAPGIATGDIARLYVGCARSVRTLIIDAGHGGRAEQLGAEASPITMQAHASIRPAGRHAHPSPGHQLP